MIGFVIGKCLVMADSDLFIICRQQASDTENPIWITQLIRISQTGSGNNKFEQRKNVFDNTIVKKISMLKRSQGRTEFIVEIWSIFFPTDPKRQNYNTIRSISGQSHWISPNLTKLGRKTLIHRPKLPVSPFSMFVCHRFFARILW